MASTIRFSVSRKIAVGLLLIIAIGTLSMLFIYRGLDQVAAALQRLAEVKAPISAAAYEQELNVNGMGLAVLKYLATRRPEYREWAQKDERDFAQYHATYLRLVLTEEERSLGRRLGELHAEFTALGHALMEYADQQERLYAVIDESTEEIDYVIDARLQPGLFAERSPERPGFGAAVASADLEAEAAEVGQWVANYHRQPTAQSREAILRKLRVLDRTLANFLGYNLSAEQRRHGRALSRNVARIDEAVREVVELEDAMHAGRQGFIELRVAMDEMLDEQIQVLALRGLDLPREQARQAADRVQLAMRYLIPLYLLAAGLIGWLLVRFIRVPLAHLNRGTRAVAGGDLTHRVSPAANDEFGDLAQQYNRMVEQLQATTVSRDRLEASEGELRRTVADLQHEISQRERAEREREHLKDELRRNETMTAMGALVAGVAHEVRNPLFGISSTLDAMTARMGERPEFGRYFAVLRNEVDRVSKLMSELLSYGRSPTREFVAGSLNDVVAVAVESCSSLARETGVTVVNLMALQPDAIRLDQGRLAQAFQNLIDNALQHAPAGSTVTIEGSFVEENGRRWIACSVRDDGPGFRPEDLTRIFEPFFTRRRGGTGLGLALVQRIVLEHGGEIDARNRPEGGAEIVVRFPRALV
jgi:C4-dicarboxylate-specific signal transduction histidine kinase